MVEDEEASGRRSRRDGSARREARAYSHPQLLRPGRRVNYASSPSEYGEPEMVGEIVSRTRREQRRENPVVYNEDHSKDGITRGCR